MFDFSFDSVQNLCYSVQNLWDSVQILWDLWDCIKLVLIP